MTCGLQRSPEACRPFTTTLGHRDGTPHLPRHPLLLVAAARRQRARGGTGRRAEAPRPRRHGARALEPCARPRRGQTRAVRRGRHRARRARTRRPDLAAQPDGCSGRRPREPRGRARGRPLRRRPRLRACAAEPLVSRASRLGRAHRRDVLLAGAARLPARQGTARAAAGPARRAACDERGDGRGRGGTLPRPVSAGPARRRPRALPAGTEAEGRRPRMAAGRTAAAPRPRPRARRGPRLDARPAPDEAARRTADPLAPPPRAGSRPHRPRRRVAGRRAPRRRRLRSRARGPAAARRGGAGGRRGRRRAGRAATSSRSWRPPRRAG